MNLITLYLRKETVHEYIGGYPQSLPAVVYYKDKAATQKIMTNRWADRPTRRNKYVMYNCNRYAVEWLPDKV